jgi:hypothetical protein
MTSILPKTVVISGKKYSVVFREGSGADFSTSSRRIRVGVNNEHDTMNCYMHEVIEAILVERGFRFHVYPGSNEKIRFVMDHGDFETVVDDIYAAINVLMEPDFQMKVPEIGGKNDKTSPKASKKRKNKKEKKGKVGKGKTNRGH